ncbi:MAG: hypothetical protein ACT4PT_14445 [Methanobacteriota archaeon]
MRSRCTFETCASIPDDLYDGPALEEREAAVLAELLRECEAQVSFQGLKRRLGLHQQILARVLRRLERDGLLAKTEKGYRPTERACAAMTKRGVVAPRHETLTIVHALLPPAVAAETVASTLSHRWFRGLRWYGASEAPGETTLTWLSEPSGTAVRVRISGGALSLEVEVPPKQPEAAYASAQALLSALAGLYAPAAPPKLSPAPKIAAKAAAA